MRTRWFLYIVTLAITIVGLLLIFISLIVVVFGYEGLGANGLAIGLAFGTTKLLSPQIRRLVGIHQQIVKQNEPFNSTYPINSDTIPLKHLSFGDTLWLKNQGKCKYNGKFLKKHVILYLDELGLEQTFELSTQELIEAAHELRSKNGVKWTKMSNKEQ